MSCALWIINTWNVWNGIEYLIPTTIQKFYIYVLYNYGYNVVFKGIWQYIFLLFHLEELLKLYVNLFYRFCVTLLFLEIFWLKIICCPPSWIIFYLIIGDFSDVISRVSHVKLHLNDQITLSLVWKVVRQFFISNSYWSIWFWAHNNQLLYG
jgi:hypothetical protein